jgi:hypothetical protein
MRTLSSGVNLRLITHLTRLMNSLVSSVFNSGSTMAPNASSNTFGYFPRSYYNLLSVLPSQKLSTSYIRLGIKEKGGNMVKSGYTPEQIISKLREVKILLS